MEARIPRSRLGDVALIVGLAAIYALTARIGLAFDAIAGFATLVWPPTGISIAALVLLGNRLWPGVFIGALIANLVSGAPVLVAVGIATGNMLEAVAAAYVLRHTPNFSITLETSTSGVGVLLAAIGPTLISTTVGVLSLHLGGVLAAPEMGAAWRAWWIGDMVAVLLVTPLILVWSHPPRARFHHHWAEVLALATALVTIGGMTFFGDHVPSLTTPFHQTDVLLGVLIWAALRFGERGAATSAFFICATAVAATVMRYGPFMQGSLSSSLLSLQTFMGIIGATCLLLGATISERRYALEEADRAHDEAARANLVKSEFLAVMSHELRTPLNAIAGYADLLTAGIYGSLNERQADAVARIRRNEKNLLAVIDEVLGFVSVEKGQVTVQGEDIPVAIAE